MALSPRWSNPQAWLAHTLLARGRQAEALEMFSRAAAGGGALDSVWLAYGFATTGQKQHAREILQAVTSRPQARQNLEIGLAVAYSCLAGTA